MALDFSEFFKRYEDIVGEADKVFDAVQRGFAADVRCKKGCCDCCHALFDLTLVEALYLNHAFNAAFSGEAKNAILERADEADRKVHRIKRDAYKEACEGVGTQDILAQIAKAKVRCPLLSEEGTCVLYAHRPVTCRIYGVPTAIGGQTHTCGRSGFEKGKAYPTVYLDRLQDKLYALSHDLADTLDTSYTDLGEILVPVSLALLTDYTEDYLGIRKQKPAGTAAAKPAASKPAPRPAAKPAGPVLTPCEGCTPSSKPGGCAACASASATIIIGQAAERAARKAAKAGGKTGGK